MRNLLNIFWLSLTLLCSCSEKDKPTAVLSEEKELNTFSIEEFEKLNFIISEESNRVSLNLPFDAKYLKLLEAPVTIDFTVSDKANVMVADKPIQSGNSLSLTKDESNPSYYLFTAKLNVVAENKSSKHYNIEIKLAKSKVVVIGKPEVNIFSISEIPESFKIDQESKRISLNLDYTDAYLAILEKSVSANFNLTQSTELYVEDTKLISGGKLNLRKNSSDPNLILYSTTLVAKTTDGQSNTYTLEIVLAKVSLSSDKKLIAVSLKEFSSNTLSLNHSRKEVNINLEYTSESLTKLNNNLTLNYEVSPKASLVVDGKDFKTGSQVKLEIDTTKTDTIVFFKELVVTAEDRTESIYNLYINLSKENLSNENSINSLSISELSGETFSISEDTKTINLNLEYTSDIETTLDGTITINFSLSSGAKMQINETNTSSGNNIKLEKTKVDANHLEYTKTLKVISERGSTKDYHLKISLTKVDGEKVTPNLRFDYSKSYFSIIIGHTPTIPLLGAYTGANAGAISYLSSNPSAISVDQSGKLTPHTVGSTKITVTQAESANNKLATTSIQVYSFQPSKRITMKLVPKQNSMLIRWYRLNFIGTYFAGSYRFIITDSDGVPIPSSPIIVPQGENSILELNVTDLSPNTEYTVKAVPVYGKLIDESKTTTLKGNTTGTNEKFIFDASSGILSGYTEAYKAKPESANLIIPETIDGHTIRAIAANAFKDNSNITSVQMPNTITVIGNSAFSGADNLKSINFSTRLETIENGAFIGTAITSITDLPNTLTQIGESAFQNMEQLTTIVIPNSVTSIGQKVLSGCTQLKNLTYSNNVTEILDFSFYETGITSFTVTSKIKTIGWAAFKYTDYLSSITIENGVSSIGPDAFNQSAITDINIPSSVTEILSEAFYGSKLRTITLNEGLESIGVQAFMNIEHLKLIVLPNSVNTIKRNAFSQLGIANSQLVVRMPNKATPPSIDTSAGDDESRNAFYKIKEIQIPAAYESAYRSALSGKFSSPTVITVY